MGTLACRAPFVADPRFYWGTVLGPSLVNLEPALVVLEPVFVTGTRFVGFEISSGGFGTRIDDFETRFWGYGTRLWNQIPKKNCINYRSERIFFNIRIQPNKFLTQIRSRLVMDNHERIAWYFTLQDYRLIPEISMSSGI